MFLVGTLKELPASEELGPGSRGFCIRNQSPFPLISASTAIILSNNGDLSFFRGSFVL